MNPRIAMILPPAPFLINEKANQPLGMAYLISYLKSIGYEDITFHHVTADTKRMVMADIFCFSFVTPQFPYAVELMNFYRTENPRALYVCGGIHPTVRSQECLDAGFDIVVKGEGEIALEKICNGWLHGPLQAVYEEPQHPNLDDFPFPDYEAIHAEEYSFSVGGKKAISMITSRGCPWACHFCSSPLMWKRKVRLHSYEYVHDLIVQLRKSFDFEAIMFHDDDFFINKEKVTKICNFLKRENISYRCQFRAENATDDNMRLLKETGCAEMMIGIESFDSLMLKNMNKHVTPEQNIEAIEMAKKHGLPTRIFILFGIPGETHETIKTTLDQLEKHRPDDLDVVIMYPFPGTEYREHPEKWDYRLLDHDYSETFNKGKVGKTRSLLETSGLTASELANYRWETFNEYSKLGGQ